MIKKVTLVLRRLLPLIRDDAKYVESIPFRTAITIPHLVLDHMLVRRLEEDYKGPEIFKKYLSGNWGENRNLQNAFRGANRMEVHLEPAPGPHAIRIGVQLYSVYIPDDMFELYTSISDKGYGGIGASIRSINSRNEDGKKVNNE